jgi:hypothetical protein
MLNSESRIENPQSAIRNRESEILNSLPLLPYGEHHYNKE